MKRLRIVVLILLLAFILVLVGVNWHRRHARLQELLEAGHYRLYYTYVAIYDEYRAFYMTNAASAEELTALAQEMFADGLITELREHVHYASYGAKPIVVHFLLPSEELPYGWEKSELNISANFDSSAFYRNTALRVTVPVGAADFDACRVEVDE